MSEKVREEIKVFISGLNANSIISTQEQSNIIDYLFRVGKKVYCKTKWYNPDTNKVETLDTYHYEATTNEAANRLGAVFENTAYKASEREAFEMDLAKWAVLGHEYKSLNIDISYVIDERIDRLVEIENERALLWEKISSVLQREEIQQEKEADMFKLLPLDLNRQSAKDVFSKAIEKGYIVVKEDFWEWKERPTLLAYMCGRIYCEDTLKDDVYNTIKVENGGRFLPEKKLINLFRVKNLGQLRRQCFDRYPPRGYENIEAIFNELKQP